jgi:Polysaccharide deacetylase
MGRATLTFDNGPNEEITPGVLAVLARHNGRASFFVIGENYGSLSFAVRPDERTTPGTGLQSLDDAHDPTGSGSPTQRASTGNRSPAAHYRPAVPC